MDGDQRKALYSGDNTLVFAGPGSGKTAVLTLKSVMEAEKLAGHQHIACLTFTSEATNEMRKRIRKYSLDMGNRVEVGTIHSFCLQYIISPFARLYLNKDDFPHEFILASKTQITAAFISARDAINGADSVSSEEMNAERKKNVGGLSEVSAPSFDLALKVAKKYEIELHSKGLVDFEDIVNYSVKILREQQYVRQYIESRYKWVFIDEYQDLGRPLHEIVLTLFLYTDIRLFIVGDTNQSIYGFTGANPEYMDELGTFKGGRGFSSIELKNNYRSSSEIVSVSGGILGNSDRYIAKKSFKDSRFEFIICESDWEDQMRAIIDRVIPECDELGVAREEIGILFTTNPLATQCKILMAENNIEAYISKRNFERTKFILWLEEIAEWCGGNSLISPIQLFQDFSQKYQPVDASINLSYFYQLITESKDRSILSDWIDWINENIPFIIPDEEKNNYKNFVEEIKKEEYKTFTVSDFYKIGKPINQVVLLTWHSAKGLEFDVIVLVGMSEGIIPRYDAVNNSKRLKEEDRKCFVGVSRAKKICYLLRSKSYQDRYGRIWEREQSRYWTLIKESVERFRDGN